MGLDITALGSIQPCSQHGDSDASYGAGHVYLNVYENAFPERAVPITEGCYVANKQMHFRAGSYSGYNRWREQLSMFALGVMPQMVWDYPNVYEGKPFYELINFADNEGLIGPIVSVKLAADFAEGFGPAAEWAGVNDPTGYWFSKYGEWLKAFQIAANAGAVQFH